MLSVLSHFSKCLIVTNSHISWTHILLLVPDIWAAHININININDIMIHSLSNTSTDHYQSIYIYILNYQIHKSF